MLGWITKCLYERKISTLPLTSIFLTRDTEDYYALDTSTFRIEIHYPRSKSQNVLISNERIYNVWHQKVYNWWGGGGGLSRALSYTPHFSRYVKAANCGTKKEEAGCSPLASVHSNDIPWLRRSTLLSDMRLSVLLSCNRPGNM